MLNKKIDKLISELDEIVTEFVYIDNDKITDFKTNIDYFRKGREDK